MANDATQLRRKSATMLLFYPPFLQLRLLEDSTFRDGLELEVKESMGLDDGAVSFDRDKFHAAAIEMYASDALETRVTDTKRRKWTLALRTDGVGSALRLVRGETQYHLKAMPVLMPGAADRVSALARLAQAAGHPPDAFAGWQARLRERVPTRVELDALERDLGQSPVAAGQLIAAEVEAGKGNIWTIAPASARHYAAFAGAASVGDAAKFRETIMQTIVDDWLRWDEDEGPKMALLSMGHSSFAAASPLASLPPDRLLALAAWACEGADLVSKVAMIELGLAALPAIPEIAAPLVTLVKQLRDMDPEAAGARAKLLMGAFILVEGELARTRALDDFPPFQRRIASLAQASLFERIAFGQINPEQFMRWALDVRGRNFMMQTLIDQRVEPRWAPEGASSDRLDADLIGRVRNAATEHAEAVTDPVLHDLLFGTGPTSIAGRISFPASFQPGPVEGATHPAPDPPQEFIDILDRTLGSEDLTAHSVIALINISSLFRVETARIDRAVELIRAGSYHFSGDVAAGQRNLLIDGLAQVAANTRRPDLANDVRIMLRRLRVDGDAAFQASHEFHICLTAAAAHAELDDWAQFIGEAAVELALAVEDRDEASILHQDLTRLCTYEPALRGTAGRALAALEAFLGL